MSANDTRQPSYSAKVTLRDGRTITIRTIRADDRERLAQHFAALSPDSHYKRFFGLRRNFGPRELERLVTPEYPLHIALVATVVDERGAEAIIGDARCVAAAAQPSVGELALSVNDPWQGRGVATCLAEHIFVRARDAGISKITAEVMASNAAALGFLLSRGFRVVGRASGVCSLARGVETTPSRADDHSIRERAYQIYLARGGRDGSPFDDWLLAEREIGSELR
jgi:GNAT superfamily N-acetyltransferase